MTTKILVPLDGSLCSEQVLPYLGWFSPPENTELVLVSVIEPAYYLYGSMSFTSPDLLTSIQSDLQGYLKGQVTRLQQAGYQVTTKLCMGDPAGEILAVATDEGVDLIAMSTHGRSGFSRLVLGSVAERVIQHATVPTFLVREGNAAAANPLQRILVPLDGSKFAEQALTKAVELAKRTQSKVLLMNAFDAADHAKMGLYMETQQGLKEETKQWRQSMGDYLAAKAEWLHAQEIDVQTCMIFDDAATAINRTAATENASLIVMSTHGRSGLERWVYGSVANKVLRTTESPMLLVRPQHKTTCQDRA